MFGIPDNFNRQPGFGPLGNNGGLPMNDMRRMVYPQQPPQQMINTQQRFPEMQILGGQQQKPLFGPR